MYYTTRIIFDASICAYFCQTSFLSEGLYFIAFQLRYIVFFFSQLLDVTSFTMDAHGKPDIDPTDITFNLTRIFVSLTPTSTQMLFAMIPNMIPQQVSVL